MTAIPAVPRTEPIGRMSTSSLSHMWRKGRNRRWDYDRSGGHYSKIDKYAWETVILHRGNAGSHDHGKCRGRTLCNGGSQQHATLMVALSLAMPTTDYALQLHYGCCWSAINPYKSNHTAHDLVILFPWKTSWLHSSCYMKVGVLNWLLPCLYQHNLLACKIIQATEEHS